jgi:hypothetical protein
MHQGWPKFTESLWMATNDNGLATVAYAPSKVKAKVGNGKEVTILEETDYPFKGPVRLIMESDKSVRFSLYLRIPGWAEQGVIKYKGKEITEKGGSTVKLFARWDPDDTVTLELPLNIRVEKRYNNSLSVLRGPLYFSLRIDKEYRNVKINYDNFGYKGSVDWEIYPKSSWNYGLMVDKNNLTRGVDLVENEVSQYPFADKGDMIWSVDSAKYIPWDKDAAVVITTRGMKIPGWILKDNSADVPPVSPVRPEGAAEVIQLVPYGSARLRITEFPVIDLTQVSDVFR